ncbi:transcriptional regulator [Saccharothrix sp. NRRL B-16348]|uniref:LysR family transcriptional regulator n=1 Tax=Saccharothrix sp. NRRL B-16348 TaxID=1415542 RepID=UPI0006C2536A|nr:LysR family transcriptional regulator [Saccharothrix sp. NRRL B-16348]KOX24840.1 transcriptional regulator [Saccharothrix sp. NRRL B-16348]
MSPLDVDTRVLRYFVAVAERLSFTGAARDLYVSQPALSRQIRQLEADLGVELFVRTGREVRLTAAGVELLPSARKALDDWRDAVRSARSAAAAEANVLRVGFVASGGGNVARRARAAFAEQRPDVTIEPKRCDWGGEPDALRQGLVDVAFVWLPNDTDGLRTRVVATEARYVALARDHPLAARESVDIADLRDEPLMWTRKAPKEWVDWWAVNPRPDGGEPVWGPENDNADEMLEHVAAGAAVCFGPESMAEYYAHPDLAWRPVTDIEPLRIAIGWAPQTARPVVRAFVEATVRLAVR